MIHVLFRFLLRLFFKVKVEGDSSPLRAPRPLIVANHESALDSVLLTLFLPVDVTVAVSRDDLKHPFLRWLIARLPHVAIEPARPLEVKRLVRTVQRGGAVAVFPEGRPSTTGALMKVYDAAAIIAARCDADIIPVVIRGTLLSRFSSVAGNFPKRWRPCVTLTIQPVVRLPAIPPLRGKQRRRRLADEMLKVMQRMAFAARTRQTLYEAFLSAIDTHGRATRIIEDARRTPESYGDLLKVSLALGRLATRVSAEGDTVGVLMPNISTTVCLLLGLSAMRRVPAMINYTAGPAAMAAACVAAKVKTVITSRRFIELARLDAAVKAFSGVNLVFVEDLRAGLTPADKLWLVCFALWRPRAAIRRADPADTAVVLFTSGSEARPKGVALSHDAILANIAQMRTAIDFGPNDRFLNALPMYHSYSLTACTLMPLVTGTRVFLYTTPLHYRAIPEIAYAHDCTYVFGTSTFLGHYARQAHPYDFYKVRVVVSGAEKLNPEVASLWLHKFGLRIMEGYGTTECAPVLTLNTPLAYKEGSVGRFLPGIEYRVIKVPGIENGGVLHVRGPNLMRGYYFYEEPGVLHAPRSEVGAGWYNTSDVVEVDDDGFVTIHGRVKRFAKIAGEMVSLEDVERIAHHASPAHQHAATIELIPQTGESTVLFTTEPGLDRIALQRAARELGAQDLAVARRIVHVSELPLLGSGKTDYVKLKAIVEANAVHAPR